MLSSYWYDALVHTVSGLLEPTYYYMGNSDLGVS
jgi:hypothetical protein